MNPARRPNESKAYRLACGAPLTSRLMPYRDRQGPLGARPTALGPAPTKPTRSADTTEPGGFADSIDPGAPRQTAKHSPSGAPNGLD